MHFAFCKSVNMVPLCSNSRLVSFLFLNMVVLFCIDHNTTVADDSEAAQGYVYALCPDMETIARSSVYAANLKTTLSLLASNSSGKNRFYNTTVGYGGNKVYGLFCCRLDITDAACQKCVSLATSALNTHCPGKRAAIVWYFDQCLVRYSNKSFLGTMLETPMIPMWNRENSLDIWNVTSEMTAFMKVLIRTMNKAKRNATKGPVDKMFATQEGKFAKNLTKLNTIYTLVECTPDITLSDGKHCLQVTIGNISELCNVKAGCTLMFPNCNLRYDTYPFYGDALRDSSIASIPGTEVQVFWKRRAVLVGIVTAAAVITVITLGLLIFVCKEKPGNSQMEGNISENVEDLKFDFGAIRSATNSFSKHNKLGEGGFDEVFKGKLQSGQEIAVKRLSRNSTQGAKEFMTEVHLVAKLQHRNLAKLLGFCLTKGEKLLIYEFCSNLSLDQLLFDTIRCPSMIWETRYKIVCGIAKVLLYLHEDSRLKIIHRDLKASNVLLDKDMNPKISDFGIARLFGEDETQGETNKIAGTFGYMAPEYVLTGHYSVKSDVYSFGIIVLEIVSGRKNKFVRTGDNEPLLRHVWRLWNEDRVTELVDKTMESNVSWEEAEKCIHIALLCIQEDTARRPRMTSVVSALSGDAVVLPSPTAPHLFTADPFGNDESRTYGSGTTFTGSKTITVMDPR